MNKVILFLGLSVLSAPAFAINYTDGQSTNYFNAAAACFPALPVYDGNVRKRPLAVVNEGQIPSYVTCGYIVDEYANKTDDGIEWFSQTIQNQQATGPRSVTCVAVVGVDNGSAGYYPQTVSVGVGQRKTLTWDAEAYGKPNGWEGPVQMSCLLPVGTALNEGRVHFDVPDAY